MFKLGLERPLSEHDIYRNLKSNDAATLTDHFELEWKKEKNREKQKPHFVSVIWTVCVSKIIGFSVLYSVLDIVLR